MESDNRCDQGRIEKRPGSENRCSHNLRSAHLGQRRVLRGHSCLRGNFDSSPVFRCFRKLKKMSISVKTVSVSFFVGAIIAK